MFEFLTYGTEKLQIFLLVIIRASGVFISAPILGNKSLPTMIKIGLAIILAIIMIPVASQTSIPQVDSVWMLAGMALKEMLVGFIIGLFFSLLFIGVRMAGNIIGFQIGLMIASVLDPDTNSQVSLASEFWYITAVLIFLLLNGHHAIISAFADSYRLVPVGMVSLNGSVGEEIIKFSAYSFTIAIKIAAPVMISLFLTTVVLGVVARTVPQMNIFIVGIPIKIGVGFLVMAATLPIFRYLITGFVSYLDHQVINTIAGMGSV